MSGSCVFICADSMVVAYVVAGGAGSAAACSRTTPYDCAFNPQTAARQQWLGSIAVLLHRRMQPSVRSNVHHRGCCSLPLCVWGSDLQVCMLSNRHLKEHLAGIWLM
jgi:hypothetical protein